MTDGCSRSKNSWQRAANRYFVQEDAKRAPKLACCQTSNQSSKQPDPGNTNIVDGSCHPSLGFRSSDRTPSFANFTPDSKWWLQMQPNYGHQRVLNPDQYSNLKDVEMDSLVGEHNNKTSEESIYNVEYEDLESVLDGKKCDEMNVEELGGVADGKVDQDLVDLRNMTDYYELLEMEMVGGLNCKRTSEFSSNSDSSWIGGEKMPWWRVTDGEGLASFVAHKSLHHVENCDLPPPQKVNVRSGVCKNTTMSIDRDEMVISSRGWEVQSDSFFDRSFGGSHRKDWSQVEEGVLLNENARAELLRSTNITPKEGRESVTDRSKAQLLEALCHSQTRAREAEEAAKQAHTEKEHLLKLFFRQASQLFAYEQWFKMLQLETLVLQTENGDSSHLTLFPDRPPWMLMKQRKLRKNGTKGKRRRRGSRGSGKDIGKYAVAFALGFTLVGAGLILGWTVGWLLL